jgi:hypothetical protein
MFLSDPASAGEAQNLNKRSVDAQLIPGHDRDGSFGKKT